MATNEPRWHPEAIEDAEGARNWYGERSPLAARAFLLALQEALVAVVDAPERWPLGRHATCFQLRYPYTLVYRLSPDIEIVAVAHQKRHPNYWTHR